jgi:FkbM family methyltransferase
LADSDVSAPITRIVDIGAHIGLSTLYFAKQYPIAKIVAVEPHPDALEYLQHNIWENHLDERVDVVAAAVVPGQTEPSETTTTLHTDPTDGWWSTTSVHVGAWTGTQETQALTVPSISLATVIDQPTDLVKIDIEGAEQGLLQSQDQQTLGYIKHLLVEFHPHPTQSLTKFLELLEKTGFKTIELWQDGKQVEARYTHNRLVLISAHR